MVKVLLLGAPFMVPYWAPSCDMVHVDLSCDIVGQIAPHEDAAFALAYNTFGGGETWAKTIMARQLCESLGIPTVWHTIEDPLSFGAFAPQAEGFDLVCTCDSTLIPEYEARFPGQRVIWLPMACQPAIHFPKPPPTGQVDFVLLANYYDNAERRRCHDELVFPLLKAGYTGSIRAASVAWPEHYATWVRPGTSHLAVSDYYPEGRIALGINSEVHGSTMCSMRIFDALACGCPILAFHADAYEALGFQNAGVHLEHEGHFVWVDGTADALEAARFMLANPDLRREMAERARHYVLGSHTYSNRLRTILCALKREEVPDGAG